MVPLLPVIINEALYCLFIINDLQFTCMKLLFSFSKHILLKSILLQYITLILNTCTNNVQYILMYACMCVCVCKSFIHNYNNDCNS